MRRPRPLRVSRLLAEAHRIQAAIDRGELTDLTDAARRCGLSRARVTQIMNLTLLAPDIQEALLSITSEGGRELLHESGLRSLTRIEHWALQRDLISPAGAPESAAGTVAP